MFTMKRFFVPIAAMLLSAMTNASAASDVYCSPNGSGNGSSASSPTSVAKAISSVQAGGTIYLLEGTYKLSETIVIDQNNCGTSSGYKTIMPYNNAKVVWDFSGQGAADGSKRGVVLDGNYWRFYGFEITKAADNGMLLSGNNNIIEMMVFNDNQDSGLQISRYRTSASSISEWPSNNIVKNCTSKNNCDNKTMENADGFAAKLTCGEGNVFDGCMAHNNSDDGWDLFAKEETGPIGVVTLKNCIAFRNGFTEFGEGYGDCDGNGFKLGGQGVGSAHVVENCLAFENLNCGFTDNNNPKLGSLKNCTAYNNSVGGNGKPNFNTARCSDGNTKFDYLISYNNTGKVTDLGAKGIKVSNDKFIGTMSNSIYYNSKYYYAKSSTTMTNGAKLGDVVTLSDSEFMTLSVPAMGSNFHTAWRNADGSPNPGGFAETNGTYKALGYHLSNGVVKEETQTNPQTPETEEKEDTSKKEETSESGSNTKPSTVVALDVIYCSPNGTGDGATIKTPTDVLSAISAVNAGGTIFLLDGTYQFSETIVIERSNSGSASAYKTIIAYPGAKVVWDFSSQGAADGSKRGVVLDGNYWRFYGFEITKAADNGMLLSGNNNIIEMMVFNDNQDSGLQISRYRTSASSISEWPSNNIVKNCTSKNNCDNKTMENADGFAAKLTCGEGNVFDGCMAHNNSDDGWDLFAKEETGPIGVVTLKNCIAFRNGFTEFGEGYGDCDGNGFKLGGQGVGSAHVVENCLAFENLNCGFTDNNNPKLGSLKNCTAYNNSVGGNGKPNFNTARCSDGNTKFDYLISYNNTGKVTDLGAKGIKVSNDKFIGTMSNSIYYNSKYYYAKSSTTMTNGAKLGDVVTLSDSEFMTLSVPAMGSNFHTAWRNADGSPNPGGFAETNGTYKALGYHFKNGLSQVSTPAIPVPGEGTEVDDVQTNSLYVADGYVYCEGDFRIYDLIGRDVTRMNGSLRGVYLVRTNSTVQKVLVR